MSPEAAAAAVQEEVKNRVEQSKLGNAIYENSEGILVLSDGYYDKNIGVVDEPKMSYCSI